VSQTKKEVRIGIPVAKMRRFLTKRSMTWATTVSVVDTTRQKNDRQIKEPDIL
jgi:hypothetical protein